MRNPVFKKNDRWRLGPSVQKRTHLNLAVASIGFSIENTVLSRNLNSP
jgi:hypothetical protein